LPNQHSIPATAVFDPDAVRRWLHLLHGNPAGLTHICSVGDWTGQVFADLEAAARHVTYLNGQGREGIYARVTTLRAALAPGRRGGAVDTAALPALWADIDLAGPGHQHDPTGHAGRILPPDEAAGRRLVATSGLPEPTVWIHSGGGLYALWFLHRSAELAEQPGLLDQVKGLSTGWQVVLEAAAAGHGWHYGRGVGDLARVLRIPGTVNRKAGLARPCRLLSAHGPRYTLDQLQAAHDQARPAPAPVPAPPARALPPPTAPAGSAHSLDDNTPLNAYERATDWAGILTPHGWREHGCEPSPARCWIRPGKDTAGHSMTTGHAGDRDRAYCFSDAAGLPVNTPMTKGFVYATLNHRGDLAAAARQLAHDGYGATIDHAATQRENLDALVPGWRGTSLPTTPPAPGPAGKPAGSPSKYFTDGGSLLVELLAHDVLQLGELAVGGDDILWRYHHGVWTPARHIVRNRLTHLLADRYRRTHAAHVEDVIRAHAPHITCDPIPDLINFRNGLLNWTTGDLGDHDPAILTTVQLPVHWTPGATCPHFQQFLNQVVPADIIPTVWELIGYLMLSGNPLHKAVMLMGTGRNGKGTLLRAIVNLLGKHNVTAASLHDLVGTRFTTASLFGRLANIAGDIDATYLETTAVFKAITGQDQISAEHKGRDRFEFTPWAVPVFSANEIPASADTTLGYLSRWLPIPFPNNFQGREDRTLDTKLATELPGIAAHAVPALRQLMARGEFPLTASTKAALDEFARRVDQVRAWLGDCCDPIPPQPHDPAAHDFTTRTTIYDAYRRWCARDGHRALSAAKLYDRLEGAGATPAKIRGERGFRGITITDSASMLTGPTQGHWWPTESSGDVIKGAGGGQVGGSVHNANLPPLNAGADQQQRPDDQGRGAEGAAFPHPSHVRRAGTYIPARETAGVGAQLPHLPPLPPPVTCRACDKPLDPVFAERWQRDQLHPSCAPEDPT
jgi:P4 family phage/plasmid primase-like protien